MIQSISGNSADRRTRLHEVFAKWIRINSEIAASWRNDDAPWWHNERASLSVFAGAIWRSGGIAYEEYAEEKRQPMSLTGRRSAYSGRCDLYFELGDIGYVAEAKQGWSGGSNDRDPVPRIRKVLRSARESASRLASHGQHRTALVFVAPRFAGAYHSESEAMINRWIAKATAIPKWEKAWVFPKSSRFIQSDNGRYYPGVMIFARSVPRAVREKAS